MYGEIGKMIHILICYLFSFWINLAQNRGRWQALMNVIMNFRVP